MLTLDDRSKFEALIADYARREIELRTAQANRHAALHAILDYTNNKLSASTRAGIHHGAELQKAKQDARKVALHKALGRIAEGTRDVRSTLSPSEVFEIAVEALKDPGDAIDRVPECPTFSGPLEPERAVGMRPELGMGFDTSEAEATPFPWPNFNTAPTRPGDVTLDTDAPQRRASDAAFADTFVEEMPEAQQLGLSHKARV